jgi:hypothetical protein
VRQAPTSSPRSVSIVGCNINCPNKNGLFDRHTEKPTASRRFTPFRFQIAISDPDLRLGHFSRAEVVHFL